jgi:hypothetical protein
MEIENIVANTVYIKARESGGQKKGKSKKWKNYLQFPHYTQCLHIRSEIDVSFGYIVEHQPIGKLLFQEFCEQNPQYDQCGKFLQKVDEYETSDDDGDTRRSLAQAIAASLAPIVANGVEQQPCSSNGIKDVSWCSFLDANVIDNCLKVADDANRNSTATPSSNIFATAYK